MKLQERIPEWLKRGIVDTDSTRKVRNILKEQSLNTVCDAARCPNKDECYSKNTATFMILGNNCTRNCRFCAVQAGYPEPLNKDEPKAVAQAVSDLNLEYVVITSVTRDDLDDEGANQFANTIKEIKKLNSNIKIEVLTPDFNGSNELIDIVLQANPDVFNHNIETVERLYDYARPQADYAQSLYVLKYVKDNYPNVKTKTGLMIGLGETVKELVKTFNDVHNVGCDIVTLGQYMQPSKKHLPVEKYYRIKDYSVLKEFAMMVGIKKAIFGPLVRSSYKAKDCIEE